MKISYRENLYCFLSYESPAWMCDGEPRTLTDAQREDIEEMKRRRGSVELFKGVGTIVFSRRAQRELRWPFQKLMERK